LALVLTVAVAVAVRAVIVVMALKNVLAPRPVRVPPMVKPESTRLTVPMAILAVMVHTVVDQAVEEEATEEDLVVTVAEAPPDSWATTARICHLT
jgi:Na+-transporting NADH:ubiquinone oxidoreductase subunit NqrD